MLKEEVLFVDQTRKELSCNAAKIAKATLATEGNRVKLSVAVLICTSLTMLTWLLSELPVTVLDALGINEEYLYFPISQLTLSLLILLFVAPVYLGVYRMSIKMLLCESAEIADVFDSFSSCRAYARAIALSLKILVRILPIILVLRIHAIMNYLSYWLVFYDETLTAVNICFVPVALLLVLFACRSFGIVSFAFFDESARFGKTQKAARKARKGNAKAIFALAYKTLCGLVLSLLSLGVAAIVHTIPLAMLNYGAVACEMKRKFETNPERNDI